MSFIVHNGDPIEGVEVLVPDRPLWQSGYDIESLREYFDGNRAFYEAHAEELRANAEAHRRISQGFVPDPTRPGLWV